MIIRSLHNSKVDRGTILDFLFRSELHILKQSFTMGLSFLGKFVSAILFVSSLEVTLAARYSSIALPVVDLGYELQQATLFNASGGFYDFSNIRYAAPPVGDLRFRAPQPPARNRGEVQTGSPDRICAQASPAWELIAAQYVSPT